jgi:hypothetical protein
MYGAIDVHRFAAGVKAKIKVIIAGSAIKTRRKDRSGYPNSASLHKGTKRKG